MLKIIIFGLLLAVIVSLGSGAVYFFKDQGEGKRTMMALGVRVTFAILLMSCVTYGIVSGELVLNAPWHNR